MSEHLRAAGKRPRAVPLAILVLGSLTAGALLFPAPVASARGISDQCDVNSECADPLVCRYGRCREECKQDRDCPVGLDLMCTKVPGRGGRFGKCVPKPSSTPCVKNADCNSNSCQAGRCR